jgi:glucose/arabinose dehydrogenase
MLDFVNRLQHFSGMMKYLTILCRWEATLKDCRILLMLILTLIAATITSAQEDQPVYIVEQVVLANYPVALEFAPDGRIFYTEKSTGNVRVISAAGRTQPEPVINLPVDNLVERGLLGIALDPSYEENRFIWVVHTQPGNNRDYPANQIVRFTERDGVGSDPQVMLSIPITTGELIHNGGNLRFDSNGYLYYSIGDNGEAANAQNLDTLPGKIHRFQVTDAGLVSAPDNPFPESSIYAYGFRNPFAFTFDPVNEALLVADNGYQCDDEINLILPGMNYGWGEDYGEQCFGYDPVPVPDYVPPLLSFNPTIGMTGIEVYSGPIRAWQGNVFYCDWVNGQLGRAAPNANRTGFEQLDPVDLQGQFCRIALRMGLDGALYFTDPGGIYRLVAG